MIAYDIETIVRPDAVEYLDQRDFRPDSRLKDPKKIEADIERKRQAAKDRGALHWWLGQVVCITAVTETGYSFCQAGLDEVALLGAFTGWVAEIEYNDTFFGKNVEDFDRPFLVGRHLAHEIPVPHWLGKVERPKDVDHIFSFSRQCSQIGSLADYAFGLGIDGKLAKGEDVAEMVQAEAWNALKTYCLQDSKIAMEMMRRYQV